MRYEICYEKALDDVTQYVLKLLPYDIGKSIEDFLLQNQIFCLNEIRIHRGAYVCFIANSRNVRSTIKISEADLFDVMVKLCGGSVYAHFNTIKEGYISLGQGIRAGICGRANVEDGTIKGISSINSINIRLPRRIYHSADYLFKILKENNFQSSIILYSRPGVGKTSILRELIYLLSNAEIAIRHAVIDSREEITPFMEREHLMADIFISYPKGQGIEIATKSMTPEMIICDEISSLEEANAILRASNCGVQLIATTHASTFEELKAKEILKELFEHEIFDYALGVDRDVGSCKYEFNLRKLR